MFLKKKSKDKEVEAIKHTFQDSPCKIATYFPHIWYIQTKRIHLPVTSETQSY